jgi:processive 1,2-diacylglycerol beta-glucosyltransferase
MIELREKGTSTVIGTITEDQLRMLTAELEEESSTDRDYYLSRDTLEMFEEDGLDPTLVAMLRQAMGSREEIEIEWS